MTAAEMMLVMPEMTFTQLIPLDASAEQHSRAMLELAERTRTCAGGPTTWWPRSGRRRTATVHLQVA